MNAFADVVGISGLTAEEGRAHARLETGDRHLNPTGVVHGGVLATLVDTAMGAAVRSTIDRDDGAATTQLTLAYLRPGRPGPITVTAQVGKQSEHVVVCQAQVDQDGERLIEALATFAITTC